MEQTRFNGKVKVPDANYLDAGFQFAIRCSTRFQSIVGNQVKIICVFFKIELQNISIRNREWFHGPIHIQFIQSNFHFQTFLQKFSFHFMNIEM